MTEQQIKDLRAAALAVARRMYVYRKTTQDETVTGVRESLEPCWCQVEGTCCVGQPQCHAARKALGYES